MTCRPWKYLAILLSAIFLLPAACRPASEPQAAPGATSPPELAASPISKPTMPNPTSPTPEITMTLEQKIGQVMVIGFDGTTVSAELRRVISDFHIGGVILFARNVQSPQQVAALTNELQKIALESGNPGLFIAIDQEGGRVARLTEATGFTEFPSAMAIAATGDPRNAHALGSVMAAEMRAVGINVDFAPDLDVNNNPANPVIGTRSFSSDPQKVAEYGVAFAQGLQENGVLAFGKHFPGHGDTGIDSHIDLPLVPHDRARLDLVELVPFRAAIAAEFAGIMSAHVTFPAIDPTPGLAATLSRPVLTGLLREELGFTGLIVTDSLEMGALAARGYPPPVGATLALAAGADLLLFNRDHAMHREAFANLVQAVKDGTVSQAQLDASVERILQTKQRFGLLDPVPVEVDIAQSKVKTPEHLALAAALAQQSITLLKDQAGLLPLQAGLPMLVIETPAAEGLGRLLGANTLAIKNDPDAGAIDSALRMARDGRMVVVTTTDAAFYPGQVKLVSKLLEDNHPVVIVAVRSPYDIHVLPEISTYLATYGSNPPALRALADVLTGKYLPAGTLPVTLP